MLYTQSSFNRFFLGCFSFETQLRPYWNPMSLNSFQNSCVWGWARINLVAVGVHQQRRGLFLVADGHVGKLNTTRWAACWRDDSFNRGHWRWEAKFRKFRSNFIAHVFHLFSPKWEYNLSKSVLVNHFIANKWEPIFSAAHVDRVIGWCNCCGYMLIDFLYNSPFSLGR